MTVCENIIEEMYSLYDEKQALHLSRFFKTGKGQYGEGDKFLGIKVPVTRSIVKKYSSEVNLNDIDNLINSQWHEIRLAGFLLLLAIYKRNIKLKDYEKASSMVEYYLSNIEKGNNWDLVDLIAPYLLGDWILRNSGSEVILNDLINRSDSLWHQRVVIVSTLTLIRSGKFDMTFKIGESYLTHPHDLIHKATGWMLREVGKKGGKRDLIEFLEKYSSRMPRTMLRYAIEKFTDNERKYFMTK